MYIVNNECGFIWILGGTYGIFDGRINELLKHRKTANSSVVRLWNDKEIV